MYTFCINVFNDVRHLKDCIHFIRKQTVKHRIVVVDGAYALFPHFKCPHCRIGDLLPAELPEHKRHLLLGRIGRPAKCLNPKCGMMISSDVDLEQYCIPQSTDGTLEIAEELADVVVEAPGTHWPSEFEKRNEYLKHGAPGDWFFVLDADERLVGQLPEADDLTDTDYALTFRRADMAGDIPYYRLFKNIGRLRYEGFHYALWRDDDLVTKRVRQLPRLDGVSILHLPLDRTTERVHLKGYYYRTGLGEIQYRRAVGL